MKDRGGYLIGAGLGCLFWGVILAVWQLNLAVPFAIGMTVLMIGLEIRRSIAR